MRVKCITRYVMEGITANKEYDAVSDQNLYQITNDEGRHQGYFKWRFEVVNENQKIVGYKLKKDLPTIKEGAFFEQTGYDHFTNDGSLDDTYRYTQPQIDGAPDWFEPVYEAVDIVLELGNHKKKVTIGKEKILVDSVYISINDIFHLHEKFTGLEQVRLFNAVVNGPTRFLRIGCETENNLFSLDEITQVINAYHKLNS